MGLTIPFYGPATPFYTSSSAVADDIGQKWDVAIAGRSYMIDTKEYERTTLDVIRQQADTAA